MWWKNVLVVRGVAMPCSFLSCRKTAISSLFKKRWFSPKMESSCGAPAGGGWTTQIHTVKRLHFEYLSTKLPYPSAIHTYLYVKQFSTVHTANARLNDAAIYFLLLKLSDVFSPLQIIILGVLGSTFLEIRMKTFSCPPVRSKVSYKHQDCWSTQCADLE